MPAIAGKWLKVSESGIVEVMNALGSPAPPEAKLVLEWTQQQDSDTWNQILTINDVARKTTFKLGEPFEHESFDGSTATSTFSMPNGHTLVQTQIHNNGKTLRVERVFEGKQMKTTLTVQGSDVTGTNDFELIN